MGPERKPEPSVPRGSVRELLRLAWPLIVMNSFFTVQISIERILLSKAGTNEVGAGMVGAMLFWAPLLLLQSTANYATTFVAQYVGAGQLRRVGPVVCQSLYFSLVGGLVFMLLSSVAGYLVSAAGHAPELQTPEGTDLRWLC